MGKSWSKLPVQKAKGLERVLEMAKHRSVSPAQIVLAWLLRQAGITSAIIGASKSYHLEEAVATLKIELSDEECRFLEGLYQLHPVLGHN